MGKDYLSSNIPSSLLWKSHYSRNTFFWFFFSILKMLCLNNTGGGSLRRTTIQVFKYVFPAGQRLSWCLWGQITEYFFGKHSEHILIDFVTVWRKKIQSIKSGIWNLKYKETRTLGIWTRKQKLSLNIL